MEVRSQPPTTTSLSCTPAAIEKCLSGVTFLVPEKSLRFYLCASIYVEASPKSIRISSLHESVSAVFKSTLSGFRSQWSQPRLWIFFSAESYTWKVLVSYLTSWSPILATDLRENCFFPSLARRISFSERPYFGSTINSRSLSFP